MENQEILVVRKMRPGRAIQFKDWNDYDKCIEFLKERSNQENGNDGNFGWRINKTLNLNSESWIQIKDKDYYHKYNPDVISIKRLIDDIVVNPGDWILHVRDDHFILVDADDFRRQHFEEIGYVPKFAKGLDWVFDKMLYRIFH